MQENTGKNKFQVRRGETGMFILDSAAAPSFITDNLQIPPILTTPMHVATANGRTTTVTKAPMNLTVAKGHDIRLKPYVLPNMESNLLAVRDLKNQHGPVLFTIDWAYIIQTQIARILNL